MQTIGDAIRKARIERNLSQEELATLAGIYRADLSRIENGKGNPTIELLDRVLKALRLNIIVAAK